MWADMPARSFCLVGGCFADGSLTRGSGIVSIDFMALLLPRHRARKMCLMSGGFLTDPRPFHRRISPWPSYSCIRLAWKGRRLLCA